MNDMEVIQRLTKVEESAKSAHHRIDDIYNKHDEVHALALSVSKLASSVENLCKDVCKVTNDVCKVTDRLTEMEKRPGKKWDHLTSIIITAIASGIIGIIITSIFMKIS